MNEFWEGKIYMYVGVRKEMTRGVAPMNGRRVAEEKRGGGWRDVNSIEKHFY